ncbi:hypothetical protein ASD65_06215 [Microbacterium sp. Root61]|uniref:hypothetical protein n=1 Tax=Microbacterium sp. Root61 TaxID=1736570 RepID=UPI0006F804F1|nr:hypothetical protein [Microbacterium sp. Root61]KRA24064.1 hypothetical protein ASD65_06215 [Microbacterium sp. Root61]
MVASQDWRSDVGLLAALRLGVTNDFGPRQEPSTEALGWLIGLKDTDAPADLSAGDDGDASVYWAEQRLARVSRGFADDGGVIVVGDTVEDFALALAYDRLLGGASWLTTDLLDDRSTWTKQIHPATELLSSMLENQARRLAITSASKDEAYIRQLCDRLRTHEYDLIIDPSGREQMETLDRETVWPGRPSLSSGLTTLYVDEHVGLTVSLPVSIEPDGSQVALLGMEGPVPSNLLFPTSSGQVPYWYVDVAIRGSLTPKARDAPTSAISVQDGPFPEVNIRASGDGLSYSPRSMGFVASGSLLTSRVGRPRIKSPSLLAWVRAMATREGMDVRFSDAGRRAELVRSRLGTRQDLLDFATPARMSMLRAFVPLERRPRPSERDPEVVVLGVDPYLSFRAMEDRLIDASTSQVLDLVDRLTQARLLRRGLVLGCEECGRPSFVYAERLGPTYECTQCAAANPLVSSSWKRSSAEPKWFYDLHPNFRELLETNGDVVQAASSRLRGESRTYVDLSEVEFIDVETQMPVAEIDVLACADDRVLVVEAKINGKFGPKLRGPQTTKLLRVASILRADSIVLATTAPAWSPQDVAHVKREATRAMPFPLEVQVIESLGTHDSAPEAPENAAGG